MERSGLAASAVLLLSLMGCRAEGEPVTVEEEPTEPTVADSAPIAAEVPPKSAREREPEPTSSVEEEPDPEPEGEVELEPQGEAAPERDLGEELRAAVGTLADCAEGTSGSAPKTIRIHISATVRPTGRVILPTAYGSGLSNDGRRCVEQRTGQVVLAPLDGPASRPVSTVVEVQTRTTTVVEGDTGVPEPRPRNVRQPLPPRPEASSSGRPPLPPREEVAPSGRPIQEPNSRKVKGPKPRPIDGHEVDEQAQDWR